MRTDEHFREANNEARLFVKMLGKHGKGGGFMKNLMQHIIFSQYYDTARWLAGALAARFPDEAIGLFGSLPDTIKDDWIEDIETLDEKMDQYIDA